MMRGYYSYKLHRQGKIYQKEKIKNLVTYQGIESLLKFNFSDEPQYFNNINVYLGLISDSSFGEISVNDTALSHSWTEFSNYLTSEFQDERAYLENSPEVNENVVTYRANEIHITESGNLKGFFIIGSTGSEIKEDWQGILWSVARVDAGPGVLPVLAGDVLDVTWEFVLSKTDL